MAKRIPPGAEYISGPISTWTDQDGTVHFERDVQRVYHDGYIQHDFHIRMFVDSTDGTTYMVAACDLVEPIDGCMFLVSVDEIGDEYNFDMERIPVPSKEVAETVYQEKCLEYATKKECES